MELLADEVPADLLACLDPEDDTRPACEIVTAELSSAASRQNWRCTPNTRLT